jgi:hypothetical protein
VKFKIGVTFLALTVSNSAYSECKYFPNPEIALLDKQTDANDKRLSSGDVKGYCANAPKLIGRQQAILKKIDQVIVSKTCVNYGSLRDIAASQIAIMKRLYALQCHSS